MKTKIVITLVLLVAFTAWAYAAGYIAVSLDDYGLVVSVRDSLYEKFSFVLVNWRSW